MFRKILFAALMLAAAVLVWTAWPTEAAAPHSGAAALTLQPLALSYYEAVLSGGDEVPPVETEAWGRAVLVLDEDTDTLYYRVNVQGLTALTAAHLHPGMPGENNPPEITLFDGSGVFDPMHPISGTVVLTAGQLTNLTSENYYINVHTAANPGGEIRGQVQSLTVDEMNAVLKGISEVPPVMTEAAGWALFDLTDSSLDYEIHVSGTMSITAAHLHPGLPGESGPPSVPLYGTGDPRAFDPSNPLTGTVTLDAQAVLDLLSGYLYLNVHTEAYPGGEIRGQVTSGYHVVRAGLRGEDEVPPVETPAKGEMLAVLGNDLHSLSYRITVTNLMSITAAHLHPGLPGESGPPDITLFDGTGTFDPDNPAEGSLTLTDEQVTRLLTSGYYVNVHTVANPGGEIRGQVMPYAPNLDYFADLLGENEVPPVITDAMGEAAFELLPGLDRIQYEISVTGTMTITASHLHPGMPGENNPPAVTLYMTGDPRPFGPGNPLMGIAPLEPQDLLDILSGNMYLNVHTEAYPGGEIRGQLMQVFKIYLPAVFKTVTFPAP